MKCGLCHKNAQGLICLKVYTQKGLKVCEVCYGEINNHRKHPYSKVMERLALAEAGYYANRKRAERR